MGAMVAAVPDERTGAVERVGTALEDFHEGKGRRGLELPSPGREVLVLVLVLRRRRGTEGLGATPVSVVESPVAVEGRPSVTVTVPVPLMLW
jgi:hypothetical protein